MILAEITAAIDPAGTLQTFYVSDGPYATSPTDTPANIPFRDVLKDPGTLDMIVYADGRTAGSNNLQLGTLQLQNNDGQFDIWSGYGCDGRPIVLRHYVEGVPYASMPVVFTGTVDGPPEVTSTVLTMRLKDKSQVFGVPACPHLFAGTNSGPVGLEGTPSDLQGKRKPKTYGRVFNVAPPCVNTSKLVYQVNDGPVNDIVNVYDRAASITKASNYATSALLMAATITAGTYGTCFAEGLFRLNATPAGTITADVDQGATAGARTVAQVCIALAAVAGVTGAQISTSDAAALDAANPAQVGIYIDDETLVGDAMAQVAQSICAYTMFDPLGVLRFGRLAEPSGTPVATFTRSQDLGLERISMSSNTTSGGGDIPAFRVTLNHSRSYTVQTSDVAGSVSDARRAFLKEALRASVPAVDLSIKNQFLLAQDYTVDTLLTSAADANAEANRLLSLFKLRRDMFQMPVPIDLVAGINLMKPVNVVHTRFGLFYGRLFLVVGLRLELAKNRATLTLWG